MVDKNKRNKMIKIGIFILLIIGGLSAYGAWSYKHNVIDHTDKKIGYIQLESKMVKHC